jgi:hypothetical protein
MARTLRAPGSARKIELSKPSVGGAMHHNIHGEARAVRPRREQW